MASVRCASSVALRRRKALPIGRAIGLCRLPSTSTESAASRLCLSTRAASAAPSASRLLARTTTTSLYNPTVPLSSSSLDPSSSSRSAAAAPASTSYSSSFSSSPRRKHGPPSDAASTASLGGRPPPKPSAPPPAAAGEEPLPFRHSRHRLPLTCTDPVHLRELTQQLLEAPAGMFRYSDDKNSRDDAWLAANDVVQRAEYLMRGHAHAVPGTQWNQWLPASKGSGHNEDPAEAIAAMESLVDRLWEEGHAYMAVRAARMEELLGPKAPPSDDPSASAAPSSSSSPAAQRAPERIAPAGEASDDEESSDSSDDDDSDEESGGSDNDDSLLDMADFFGERKLDSGAFAVADDSDDDGEEDEEEEDPSYMNDFSLPGPTTHMYDILLDSFACFPTEPKQGFLVLQNILGRHGLDGGDESNANPHTRPTVMSYNAPIRLAAELPYAAAADPSRRAELRDEALRLALGSFDALSHSGILSRNSATYAHLLRVIVKYLPPGTARGNVSLGMFHHARVQGLVDDSVLAAFLSAHDPGSNGDAFDAWIAKHLGSPPVREAKELPHKWRRHSRGRRFHPREATY